MSHQGAVMIAKKPGFPADDARESHTRAVFASERRSLGSRGFERGHGDLVGGGG